MILMFQHAQKNRLSTTSFQNKLVCIAHKKVNEEALW